MNDHESSLNSEQRAPIKRAQSIIVFTSSSILSKQNNNGIKHALATNKKQKLRSNVILCTLVKKTNNSEAAVKQYHFDLQVKKVSRLCHSKPIVTVNGMFPGPTIYVREGDRVLVNVTNNAQYNMSIHWHGLKHFRNGWADGPAYITQCPIKTGQAYTYDFNVTGQRGTLWWHAHIFWLRATVYGAIVIMPKPGTPYPFPQPNLEFNLLLGEWWNTDVEEVVKEGTKRGLPPNMSDAHTFNGKPGPLFPCSEKHTFVIEVEQGKTYLIRIINAALNDELFFAIAGHTMTVVEIDAVYTKPFTTQAMLIAPGQTTNVLIQANQVPNRPPGSSLFQQERCVHDRLPRPPPVTFNYTGAPLTANLKTSLGTRLSRISFNSTVELVLQDTNLLTVESHPFHLHGYNFFVVGTGIGNFDPKKDPAKFNLVDPPERNTVGVPTGGWTAIRFRADNPGVWLMHCHLELHTTWGLKTAFVVDNGKGQGQSVLPPPKDLPPYFPDRPPVTFNYTGAPLTANLKTSLGTRLSRISFNSTVELVLQDTNLLAVESHPFHLHGYNFFVVGTGIGNFDPKKDPAKFNLVDPPERNTVGVPTGGWTAIRFRADNPGVWLMHCHVELHTTWGLKTAFVVDNGKGRGQSVLPPPKDLPPC
ncbi:Laccase-2 [Camellia lanceoleosa]|uniref:Laccase-2 n=1 Tax=Camellia lanceoleosa TaxID=1840588 RepID=A0ACC0IJE3_9ERIC|nr:Laccase-2 [Camellia lanceoleosa]